MGNSLIPKLYKFMPTVIKERIMKSIVINGYNNNSYNALNRKRQITEHEMSVIDLLFSRIDKKYPEILDIGCGNGALYDTYMSKKGAQIYGIDVVQGQIDSARLNVPKGIFICADFMHWNPNMMFDGITAFYSIFNMPRRLHKSLYKKMYKWLRPGGWCLILLRVEAVGDFKYHEEWCGAEMAFSYDSAYKMYEYAHNAGFTGYFKTHEDNDEYVWLYLLK